MSEERDWQASFVEHRTAWILALCCLLLILITSLKPDLFEFPEQEQAGEPSPPVKHEPQLAEKITPPLHKKTEPEIAAPVKAAVKPVVEPVKKAAAPVVQKQKTAVKKSAGAAMGYYVQLGAFREKPRAQGLVDQLKHQGWKATVSPLPNKDLHAVWAGPEATRAKAEQLQSAIAKKLNIKGFITQQKTR